MAVDLDGLRMPMPCCLFGFEEDLADQLDVSLHATPPLSNGPLTTTPLSFLDLTPSPGADPAPGSVVASDPAASMEGDAPKPSPEPPPRRGRSGATRRGSA